MLSALDEVATRLAELNATLVDVLAALAAIDSILTGRLPATLSNGRLKVEDIGLL